MAVDLVIDRDLPMVETRLVGKLAPNELMDKTAEMVRLVSIQQKYLILEDCTELEDWHSALDMYEATKILAQNGLVLKIRKAVILPTLTEAISKVQFWVTVCQNRGMKAMAFENRQNALHWLISDHK